MREVPKRAKDLELISRLFLFEGAAPTSAAYAMNGDGCVCRVYEAGEAVYTKICFERSVGVVISGELKAVKSGLDGVVLNKFYSGGVFGVAGLFNARQEYVSEVIAVKRSRVLFFPQTLLQRLFRLDSAIAENYIAYLSGRICFLNGRIDNYTGGSAENRLAGFLSGLAQEQGESLILPFSLTSLADTLDIGRASLYRAMDALEAAGTIVRQGRNISVVNLELLKKWR